MSLITGQGTTFNLPNYRGELFQISPSDTPFLSAIGGLDTQQTSSDAPEFEWQAIDHASPSQPGVLEGANAPTATNRARVNISNLVQIFHYSFDMSYTKLAAQGNFAGINTGQPSPIMDDMAFQQEIKLEEAGMDIDYSLLRGYYAKPATNSDPRRTRGLLRVPTTNVSAMSGSLIAATAAASTDKVTKASHGLADTTQIVLRGTGGPAAAGLDDDIVYFVRDSATNDFKVALTSGGAAVDITADIASGLTYAVVTAITKVAVLDMLQGVFNTSGVKLNMEPTLMCGATIKRSLTKAFITDAGYNEISRNVGGVSVTRIETDFGAMNIMMNRRMPASTLAFTHLGMCQPIFMLIPGKGFLFTEPLAKTGASERAQLYGECGLKYGPESAHALLLGVSGMSGA
jgi:hypothetical protein